MTIKKLIRYKSLVLIAALINSQLACATAQTPPDQIVKLSERQNFSAFDQVGNANWSAKGDIISADKGSGFLVTKDSFSDFYLKLEFFAQSATNSGVFFRCDSSSDISDQKCYEANIFDTRPDQIYRTGAITGHSSPTAIINSEDGKWHTYEIRAVGDRMQLFLDGKETVFLRNKKHSAGPIALQLAQGAIKFRNIRLARIEPGSVSTKTPIDGVWELKSFNSVDPEGKVTPWCEGSFGAIIYVDGYMSVAINCLSDSKKMLHYSGPFHLEGNSVIHRARNYSDASLNQIFRRAVQMPDSEHLELSGPLSDGGRAVIVWERR